MKHLETGKDDFFNFRKCLLKYEHMFVIMSAKYMNICLERMIFSYRCNPGISFVGDSVPPCTQGRHA